MRATRLLILSFIGSFCSGDSGARRLRPTIPLERQQGYVYGCFEECVNRQFTGQECAAYIRLTLQLEPNFPVISIEIEDIWSPTRMIVRSYPEENKIYAPVSAVQVHTNLLGRTKCFDYNPNATIVYPFLWPGKTVGRELPTLDCAELDPLACCEAFMTLADVKVTQTSDGQCFSCWISQSKLEPLIIDNSTMVYLDTDYQPASGECWQVQRTVDEVHHEVKARQFMLQHTLVNNIQLALEQGATCMQLFELQQELMINARSIPQVTSLAHDLLCEICGVSDPFFYDAPLPNVVADPLNAIRAILINHDYVSDVVPKIKIYTNSTGHVSRIPYVGGDVEHCNR